MAESFWLFTSMIEVPQYFLFMLEKQLTILSMYYVKMVLLVWSTTSLSSFFTYCYV